MYILFFEYTQNNTNNQIISKLGNQLMFQVEKKLRIGSNEFRFINYIAINEHGAILTENHSRESGY